MYFPIYAGWVVRNKKMTTSKMNSHVAIKYVGIEDKYSYQQIFTGLKDCLNNLGGIEPFNPLLSRALVELSYKAGAEKVYVGDCFATGLSSTEIMEKIGITKETYKAGGELIGLEKE